MTLTWLLISPSTICLRASAMPSNRTNSAMLKTFETRSPRSMPNGSEEPEAACLDASGMDATAAGPPFEPSALAHPGAARACPAACAYVGAA